MPTLSHPGDADLTAHVDFGAVARLAGLLVSASVVRDTRDVPAQASALDACNSLLKAASTARKRGISRRPWRD